MKYIVIALATPAPTAPMAGAPRLPNMNTQLPVTLTASAPIDTYMTGRVQPIPSVV